MLGYLLKLLRLICVVAAKSHKRIRAHHVSSSESSPGQLAFHGTKTLPPARHGRFSVLGVIAPVALCGGRRRPSSPRVLYCLCWHHGVRVRI